jgi:hypothetical protein
MSDMQRALWTFLIYGLLAPFFAALVIAVTLALASAFGLAHLLPDGAGPAGAAAVAAFVWATVPALLTGIVLAAMAWSQGGFTWIAAAAVAVIAFTIAAVIVPMDMENARPYLAFLAGVIAIAVRAVLSRIGVLAA